MLTIARTVAFGLLAVMITDIIPKVAALDFTSSQWIWTNEVSSAGGNAPLGHRAFRKDIGAVAGKTPLSAHILISADDEYTLYVNGQQIGSGTNFAVAQSYCIALGSSSSTVIAVDAENIGSTPNWAGVVAAMQITYTDGSTSTFVSDSSWRFSLTLPANFEQPSFDDSAWLSAVAEGAMGALPWRNVALPPASNLALCVAGAKWIWTNDGGAYGPTGPRAFRYIYTAPSGQLARSLNVYITADNLFYLYVNGNLVGNFASWSNVQFLQIPLSGAVSQIVFAVFSYNESIGPSGVLAAIEIITTDANTCDTASTVIVTNESWNTSFLVPNGFELPGFDDSSWVSATSQALYGGGEWGTIPVPCLN